MSLLDRTSEDPAAKRRRYIVSAVALVILLGFGTWYFFLRFIGEKRVVQKFMDEVVAGNYEQAYQIWNPHGTYSYQDFLADWGQQGYYAPIGSYEIVTAEAPRGGGSGVIVVLEVSPFEEFPSGQDPRSGRNREVRLWVEGSDKSLSFPP